MYIIRMAQINFKKVFTLIAIFVFSFISFCYASGLDKYLSFIKDPDLKKLVEDEVKDRLHSELEKFAGTDIDVETYLKIIDDYANGDFESAKSAVSEKAATALAEWIFGSYASVVTAGWDFAKYSYSSVQKWADDQRVKKFSEEFLEPRIKEWEQGRFTYGRLPELKRQFDEWFSRDEIYAFMTATVPPAEREKYLEDFKERMWDRVVEISTKWRKYYRDREEARKIALRREKEIKYLIFEIYQEKVKEINNKKDLELKYKLNPELAEKEKNKTVNTAQSVANNTGVGKDSTQTDNTKPKGVEISSGVYEINNAELSSEEKRRREEEKKGKEAYAEIWRKMHEEKETHEQFLNDCREKFRKEQEEQNENLKKRLELYKEQILDAFNSEDWDRFWRMVSESGIFTSLKDPGEYVYYECRYEDSPYTERLMVKTDPIKERIRIYREYQEELKSTIEAMKELHQQTVQEAKDKMLEVEKTLEILNSKAYELFDFSSMPVNSNIAKDMDNYRKNGNFYFYLQDIGSYIWRNNFIGRDLTRLSETSSAINTARSEISSLSSYVNRKIEQMLDFKKNEIYRAKLDHEKYYDWYKENYIKLGSVRERNELESTLIDFERRIDNIEKKINDYYDDKINFDTEITKLEIEFKKIESTINYIYFLNNKYSDYIRQTKQLSQLYEQVYPVYKKLGFYSTYLNNPKIQYGYSYKTLHQFYNIMKNSDIIMTDKLVKIILDFDKEYGVTAIMKRDVDKWFSFVNQVDEYYRNGYKEGVFPVSEKMNYLFPKIKQEVNSIMIPFIKKTDDYALGSANYSKHGIVTAIPSNIWEYVEEFKYMKNEADKVYNKYFKPQKTLTFEELRKKAEDMYSKFKNSYRYGNLSGVMSCIDRNWETNSGETYYDLMNHLRDVFSTFNRFNVDIKNLKIEKSDNPDYDLKATYSISISAHLNDFNSVSHKESGKVIDYLVYRKDKVYIIKTIGTAFFIGR